MRVVAAMSGGVDSAVAASRMIDAGHDVVGVHLALSQNAKTLREGARGCCTIEDAGDARRVADRLGIPFYVWDMADAFQRDVMEDFVAEYEAGRTPNPCLRCNEKIKFSALLDKALALGFDAVAIATASKPSASALSSRAENLIFSLQRRHGFGVRPASYSATKSSMTSRWKASAMSHT